MDLSKIEDELIVEEIKKRFQEKEASIKEMEFMTKKLLEMNEQTKKAEQIKGEFLSIIKNEFNNPISSLLNLANSLNKKLDENRYKSVVGLLNMELLRLDFHLKNIFAATDIEAGDIANYYARIDINSIYEDVLKSFKYILEEKNLTMKIDNRVEMPIVSDSNKIFVILLNLISNACEFSFENSQIIVSFYVEDDKFVIKVHDEGEGVNVAFEKMVFDRFSKFSSGRTRAHTGLGLGLSVTRGFAEALEGDVEFDSKEGETNFYVKIPLVNDEIASHNMSDSNTLIFDDFEEGIEL